ncbi:MAG: hypothetical protein IJS17_05500, partial [Clostridia bacterium]|nr:hypothetical protein [Clostridia bacterium]
MNAKVRKKRFWAAMLSIVAVFALALSGVETPKMQSVYAAVDGDVIVPHGGTSVEIGGTTITLQVWNNNTKTTWSQVDNNNNNVNWKKTSGDGEVGLTIVDSEGNDADKILGEGLKEG